MRIQQISLSVPVLSACLVFVLSFQKADAQTCYLKAGDEIVTFGDSITGQGVYQAYMQGVIDTLYPGSRITVVNYGSGGKSADSGVAAMKDYPRKGPNSIATVMFGVNDTRWAAAGMEAKAKTFVQHMGRMIEIARESKMPIIFLRETHFSHNAAPDAWADSMTEALEYLLEAADKLAAENDVPVIDVLGAYREALSQAWKKDPKYEFTPDVVHPTQPGHAAMATEILRAMGVGLPQATEERGPLHLERKAAVKLEAVDDNGMIAQDGAIALLVRCRNVSDVPLKGEVTIVLSGHKDTKTASVAAGGTQELSFEIPADKLKDRWGVEPLYMVFKGDDVFAAEHALFYYSKVFHAAKQAFVATAEDFRPASGEADRACPVSRVSVNYHARAGIIIEFKWTDEKIVPAKVGFKNRFGRTIRAPLDLRSRDGQPCDAIEFYFDLRPDESIGRFTCNADSNPRGVTRIGVYKAQKDGKFVTQIMPPPPPPSARMGMDQTTFTEQDDGTCILRLPKRALGSTLGFSMRVTDADEFGLGKGPVFYLTGRAEVLLEPMSYIMLSPGKAGIFYRVGY